jgi:hypothetical protein
MTNHRGAPGATCRVNIELNDNADNNPASPTLLAAKEYKNQQLQQL